MLAVPLAASHGVGWHAEATIASGEVDEYWGGALCGGLLGWPTMRLTLLDPAPGDAVLLLVAEPPWLFAPGVAIATHDDPEVEASYERGIGCEPSVWVAGLQVEGERPYRVTWIPMPLLPAIWPVTG
jgi:hypothetical protein